MGNRKISQAGIDLIKSFEGCRLIAYNPTGKEAYLTIGWGHYGADVYPGMTITQEQADNMLADDMGNYEAPVNALNLGLNQNQFDALVSFCYNCGAGNLRDLCLGRTIGQIAAAIPLYNKGGGVVLQGLVKRRAAELELFNKKGELEVEDWAYDFIEQVMGDYWNRMDGNEDVQKATNAAMNALRRAMGREEQ